VDLLPDDDQAAVGAAARALVESLSPAARLGSLDPATPVTEPRLWELAARQGFFALDLPEDAGGAGLTLAELALVFRELGRNLVAGPYLGTVVAARVALAAGDAELAGRIAAGQLPVGLAEPVTGDLLRTFDADDAAAFVVVSPEGSTLHPAGDAEVVRRRPCVDAASRWAELRLPGTPLAPADATVFDARSYASVLIAAQLAGICAATRDASAAYAKVRTQFDVPIGSFQAVKHRCADQAVRAEAIDQLVTFAALAVRDGRPEAALLWPAARTVGADSALRNAADNIQNHGGIGYTAEHEAHLYLKRTQVLADLLLPREDLRDAVLAAPPARPA
jgi:alkylation response protein AidB-like acyl-CoA dehydrogenase